MKEDLEKLKRGFKYIKGCMLLGSDGEVITIDVDNQEELAFKLSILFDLENLEEILIEKTSGANYIKMYDSRLVFLEFTRKPNIPLLNMYLKRIFSAEREPERKLDIEKKVEMVLAEAKREEETEEKRETEEQGDWKDVSRIFSMR
jgi:predicted regulator of Ras-like GTPase activity (Roadblock/LC7/MglB family)